MRLFQRLQLLEYRAQQCGIQLGEKGKAHKHPEGHGVEENGGKIPQQNNGADVQCHHGDGSGEFVDHQKCGIMDMLSDGVFIPGHQGEQVGKHGQNQKQKYQNDDGQNGEQGAVHIELQKNEVTVNSGQSHRSAEPDNVL